MSLFSSNIQDLASKSKKAGKTPADPSSVSPVTRTAISLEYASLRHRQHCPLGMYVVPSHEDLLVWDAVLFIHKGYYTDAILRFRIDFPVDYPDSCPTVLFQSDVFHPLISPHDGIFNLSPRFRPWRPKEHHVFDILHFIKSVFKKHALDAIALSDCLNKESFRYHESTSSFAALTLQTAVLSQSKSALFDRDHPSMSGKSSGLGIEFKNMKPEQLKEQRAKIGGLQEWEEPKN